MECSSAVKVSLDSLEKEELQNLSTYLQNLYTIWADLGMDDKQKLDRGKIVWKHIGNLLQDILDEEQSFFIDIKERIQNYSKKIEELSKELSILPNETNYISLIKKEEGLRLELDNLSKLKHRRLKTYNELRSIESVYCSVLGVKEYQLMTNTNIPTETDLSEIDKHIHVLTKERDKRHKKFCLVKEELNAILEATELTPDTTFEREILSSDSDNISLTDKTFETLEKAVTKVQNKKLEMAARKKFLLDRLLELWSQLRVPEEKKTQFLSQHIGCRLSTLNAIQNELDVCEKIRVENLKLSINTLKKSLKQLWEQCYTPNSETQTFTWYHSKQITQEVLENLEKEVKKMKEYFEEVKPILLKIKERETLWNSLQAFENKMSDPARYKNRKGNLLQEEKDRKKLQKDLPSLENEIFSEIDRYEAISGKHFLYHGEDYRTFITNQWQERIDKKENLKIARHKQRLLQVENEMLGTPSNRRCLTTPKSAPCKLINQNMEAITGKTVYYTPVAKSPRIRSILQKSKIATPKSRLDSNYISAISDNNFDENGIQTSEVENISVKSPQIRSIMQRSKPATPKSRLGSKFFSAVSDSKFNENEIQISETENISQSLNSTTYSDFANELNSFSKDTLRSSVLRNKKTPIKVKKNFFNARKSVRIAKIISTTQTATPTRAKLGLPFLI